MATTQELRFVAEMEPLEQKLIHLCAASIAWDEELGAISIHPKNEAFARAMWRVLHRRKQAKPWVILISET